MSKKPVKSQAPEGSLQRQLSPMHVWAIAFGCVIGWGSFINPGKKFLANSGVAGTAIAMVLGAIVMIIIAFSYAYMVPKYPKAGGEFTFTKNCFGKTTAFICGWFLVAAYLTNVPMNSTAIALIIDGLTGHRGILNFGFHYTLAGTDIYLGQMLPAMFILILFGWLNIIGVKKAGFVQTVLASLLVICVFTLFVAALVSAKAKGVNMAPIWGFDKAAAMEAGAVTSEIGQFAHKGSSGILSAILATFAIAPWAYVGFDAIPQAAEEFNFSFKKVSFIMIVAIIFGCFVYTSNNTVAAAALENWPERVMAGEWVAAFHADPRLGGLGALALHAVAKPQHQLAPAIEQDIAAVAAFGDEAPAQKIPDGDLRPRLGRVVVKRHFPSVFALCDVFDQVCGEPSRAGGQLRFLGDIPAAVRPFARERDEPFLAALADPIGRFSVLPCKFSCVHSLDLLGFLMYLL